MKGKTRDQPVIAKVRLRRGTIHWLETLEPGWIMVAVTAIPSKIRSAMVKRGLMELRAHPHWHDVRLTPLGRVIRDRYQALRARRLNTRLHGRASRRLATADLSHRPQKRTPR